MGSDLPDLHAAEPLFWADAKVVHERSHAGRTLLVLESAPAKAPLPVYLCVITDSGRLEGKLTLSPEGFRFPWGTVPRVDGVLISRDHESYRVRRDSFTGGPLELADLACQLLDNQYEFPANAGVTADNFVWIRKPKPK